MFGEVDSLSLLGKWVESLDYQLEILTDCTRYKSPRSTCQKCLDVCESEAVTFVNHVPVIARDRCVECGKCMSACPVQAVAGIFPKRTVVQNQLVLTAEDFPTVKELLVLYKKGVREIISEDPAVFEGGKQVLEKANKMLDQLGEESVSVSTAPFEKAEKIYSRRELFSLWNKEGQTFAKQAAPAKWRFNHTHLDVAKYYPDFQFTTISVDTAACTLCKACEHLCGKNCLTISETSFSVTAQACSSCQLCSDICPEQAISIEDQISPAHEVHYPIFKKTCSVCKQPYETLREHDDKCVACTKREGFLSTHESRI